MIEIWRDLLKAAAMVLSREEEELLRPIVSAVLFNISPRPTYA